MPKCRHHPIFVSWILRIISTSSNCVWLECYNH